MSNPHLNDNNRVEAQILGVFFFVGGACLGLALLVRSKIGTLPFFITLFRSSGVRRVGGDAWTFFFCLAFFFFCRSVSGHAGISGRTSSAVPSRCIERMTRRFNFLMWWGR